MSNLKLVPNAYVVLKKERKKAGMTQVALAKKMGLKTSQQIWNLENEKNRLTLEIAIKAANALGLSLDVFLCQKVK